MSSGFVSGGTVENPTERDNEWRQAQAELEAARKAKADLAARHDGKSLFEVLQENKDKKQAEFEERARYKLHVSLNDDEADYLDSIEEQKRKEEAQVKKDTREQLEMFRRQQEEDARKALEDESAGAPTEEQVHWTAASRKRKKGAESGLLKGVKLRKANSTPDAEDVAKKSVQRDMDGTKKLPTISSQSDTPTTKTALLSAKPAGGLSLGLGYALSDDDDDDDS
jgi:hypothetical protein